MNKINDNFNYISTITYFITSFNFFYFRYKYILIFLLECFFHILLIILYSMKTLDVEKRLYKNITTIFMINKISSSKKIKIIID